MGIGETRSVSTRRESVRLGARNGDDDESGSNCVELLLTALVDDLVLRAEHGAGRQHACMQVSQSEKQPQRPVLHLSDMLAGDRSVSLRARVGKE